ncbi:hypothetical protein LCM27_06505 [Ruegeria marisrubri]|uniref:hypothetical protein n=1 Tax=Ruegeria marisrubri TaxID=1685379 RepID=UPI001CD5CD95|nr:hypothetical protein [Ruegeria marisrubri]MCA0906045.1 hypothetical protein [Ruegeria marisrubri]
MKDRSAGGILAFIVAAPVVVICCGGHAAAVMSILSGAIGTATGLYIIRTLLIAVGTGVAVLSVRTILKSRRDRDAEVGNAKEPS